LSTALYTSPKLDGLSHAAEHEQQSKSGLAWPTREGQTGRKTANTLKLEFVRRYGQSLQRRRGPLLSMLKTRPARLALPSQIRILEIPSDD